MSEEREREKELLLYFKYHFRIILVGDSNTGKTTICNTLLDRKNPFMQYQPTIGIDLNVPISSILQWVKPKFPSTKPLANPTMQILCFI